MIDPRRGVGVGVEAAGNSSQSVVTWLPLWNPMLIYNANVDPSWRGGFGERKGKNCQAIAGSLTLASSGDPPAASPYQIGDNFFIQKKGAAKSLASSLWEGRDEWRPKWMDGCRCGWMDVDGCGFTSTSSFTLVTPPVRSP